MRTLLLADDSVTTQRVIALTFADESFRVITVADGQQAIDRMAGMRPDIVLAGTTLPRLNGYELSQYMRGVASLKDVPVLLLSGAFESVDTALLKSSGARGVIEKPLEPTAVISRVRELLGLKDARPAPQAGRLVTSAETAADRKTDKKTPPRLATAPPSGRKPAASSWDDLRTDSGPGDARSADGAMPGAGREDYLDTLDAAFDSLDQHLAGRHPDAVVQRNPSGPLGQASGAPDPRSPGRRPAASEGGTPNSVFEVDTDWFGDDVKERDRASRHDILADAHEAMPPRAPGDAIFEVDDEWFAEDEKERQARAAQQRELAAEMGIHDVELPEAEPVPNAPAPAEGLDFDFGLDDLVVSEPAKQEPEPEPPAAQPVAVVPQAPVAPTPVAPLAPLAPLAPAPLVPTSVADDFAALLAYETGDAPEPMAAPAAPAAASTAAQPSAPEITEAMLDQIAQRVADRLNSGAFGTSLRDAMAATVRDTVRSVVSDTSERLVRDEIARIKARVERDTP